MNAEAKELKARTAEEIYDFIEGVQAHKHDYEFKKRCIINTLTAWKREILSETREGNNAN